MYRKELACFCISQARKLMCSDAGPLCNETIGNWSIIWFGLMSLNNTRRKFPVKVDILSHRWPVCLEVNNIMNVFPLNCIAYFGTHCLLFNTFTLYLICQILTFDFGIKHPLDTWLHSLGIWHAWDLFAEFPILIHSIKIPIDVRDIDVIDIGKFNWFSNTHVSGLH